MSYGLVAGAFRRASGATSTVETGGATDSSRVPVTVIGASSVTLVVSVLPPAWAVAVRGPAAAKTDASAMVSAVEL
jgi:hypothetical protein